MKNIILAIALALTASACTEDVADDQPSTEAVFEKKIGIVDCNNSILNSNCTECGNGGNTTCCDPYYDSCDVLCNHWKWDPKHIIRWCAL